MTKIKNKTVLATGGRGFLGKHVVALFEKCGANVIAPSRDEYDLRKEEDVIKLYNDTNPDIVVHMAVNGGGINYNKKHPGSIYYDNILMNTYITHYAASFGVEKLVGIGTVCSYPKYTPTPFSEDNLWYGYPEETNASYGLAKKMLLVQGQAYREEYDLNAIHLLLVNMYGPHDNFNVESSHVIPALIKKYSDAISLHKNHVIIWGNGSASREFLFVKDAANAILLATKHYDDNEPINVGSGKEISIRELSKIISDITGFLGDTIWDKSKPDGQLRRCLDISRAEKYFSFRANTSLLDGLRETWDWYQSQFK